MSDSGIVIAAKCAPDETILADIEKAGLRAVELYTCSQCLNRISEIVRLCRRFSLRYAIHAPTDSFQPAELAELSAGLKAEVVVFHDIYWEDEWKMFIDFFQKNPAKLCIENVSTIHEPLKFMRRFGLGRCLDLEHVQMEVGGVFEEEFLRVMETASHVHMTGYSFGSNLWYSHIHHSPEHSTYLIVLPP